MEIRCLSRTLFLNQIMRRLLSQNRSVSLQVYKALETVSGFCGYQTLLSGALNPTLDTQRVEVGGGKRAPEVQGCCSFA